MSQDIDALGEQLTAVQTADRFEPVESAKVAPDENALLRRALQDAEAGLVFAGADVEPAGDFVPTPTLALRAVRAALASEPVKPQEPAATSGRGVLARSLADEIMLTLEAATAPHMRGQWTYGSWFGDHSDHLESDLLPRIYDFLHLIALAAAPANECAALAVKPQGEPPDEQLQAAFERSSGGPYFRCKTCGMTEPRTCLAEHFKKCNAIAMPGTNQSTIGE